MTRKERREQKERLKEKRGKGLSPDAELAKIRRALKFNTFEAPVRHWLNTGSSRLNAVLGSEEFGLAYGKMIEISGQESQGKTLLGLLIAGLAQKDGADVGWVDLEDSFDEKWATVQGVDVTRLYRFQPRIGVFPGDKKPRLQTAEELMEEVEAWMQSRHEKNPNGKLWLVVDSVAGLQPEDEAAAGITGQNMRTKVALASFLSILLRRWIALTSLYNCGILWINQLRSKPGAQKYEDPQYEVGGRAMRFYCAIRCRMRRIKGGRILQAGKVVGLRSVIKNRKNKAGGGSREGEECGFKASFHKKKWKFMAVKKLKSDAEGEGGEE